MALLAVHAAQALLLGFAFKLKVAATSAGAAGLGASRGLELPATRPMRRQRAAGFLGACLPPAASLPGSSNGPLWSVCALVKPETHLLRLVLCCEYKNVCCQLQLAGMCCI